MISKKRLILLLTCYLLSSCSQNLNTQVSPSSLPTYRVIETESVSDYLPTAIESGIAPTPSQIPTTYSTQTLAIDQGFEPECLPIAIEDELNTDSNAEGSLIFEGYNDQPSYFYNFDTNQKQEIPKNNWGFTTSPNGQWKVYIENEKRYEISGWLVIEDAKGNNVRRIPVQKNWNTDPLWVNGHAFVFNIIDSGNLPSVLLIDMFTGDQKILRSEFPNLLPYAGLAGNPLHFVNSSVVYDPSLRFVIYPRTDPDGKRSVVLWDTLTQNVLGSLLDEGYFGQTPVWSWDGSEVYLSVTIDTLKQDWFIMDRTGKVSRFTHFSNEYDELLMDGSNLSPSGHHISFWFSGSVDTKEVRGLAVMNLDTKNVTSYCIERTGRKTIWSPDGQYLAVEHRESGKSVTVLVDIRNKSAIIFEDNVYPTGWVVTK